jgi:hypothetical protein
MVDPGENGSRQPRRRGSAGRPAPHIDRGKQDKHIAGSNNYIPGRSQGNRIWQNASARVPLMRIVCGSQIKQARITRSTRKSRLSHGVHGKQTMALRASFLFDFARSAITSGVNP